MSPVGTQDWAKGRISPHKDRLWRAMNAGIVRLNRLNAEDLMVFNGRCAADVLNAFVIAEARTEFESIQGSQFIEKNNTTYHSLNGCVLWYKQLGEDHLPSNIPTMTVDQMMQGQFEFMPDQLLMVVGFELDAVKQKLKTVELMRFGPGKRLEFVIEIAKVQVAPRVVRMPDATKPMQARRTKIELRNGFEQKSFGSGSEQ